MGSVNEANQAQALTEQTTGQEIKTTKRADGVFGALQQGFELSVDELIKALPSHMAKQAQSHIARMIRVATTLVRNSESLQKCDPISIIGCVIQGAQLGLEVDGVLGNAYMVPYSNIATFQVGYKGLINLAHRSPRVAWVDAKFVYAGDFFEYEYGTDPFIKHKPKGEWRFEKITHAYSVIKRSDGSSTFEVWPLERVMAHKEKFSKSYKKKDSPWNKSPEAMILKTVLRQGLKYAPANTDLQYAIGMDEIGEVGVNQNLHQLTGKTGMELGTTAQVQSLGSKLEAARIEVAEQVEEDVSKEITIAHNNITQLLNNELITDKEREEYKQVMDDEQPVAWYEATAETLDQLISSRQIES